MVKGLLEDIITEFNRKIEEDQSFAREVKEKDRTVQFLFDGGEAYHMELKDGRIRDLIDGPLDGADISVMTDVDTFKGIVEGDISPMRAYATKKLRLKASLQDLLTLRKFL